MSRLFLKKNDITKNDKIPYFTLCVIPEEGDSDKNWKEVAVFWKAKSGNGYTGQLSNGSKLDLSGYKPFTTPKRNYQEPSKEDLPPPIFD